MGRKSPPIGFAPTTYQLYQSCGKKYYLYWLSERKRGNTPKRIEQKHLYYQLFRLKHVKHRSTWAGLVFHQVVAAVLTRVKNSRFNSSLDWAVETACEVARLQFKYSQTGCFGDDPVTQGPRYRGISLVRLLYEHEYGLPDDDLLEATQEDLKVWLQNLYSWDGWDEITALARQYKREFHVEPNYHHIKINNVGIHARTDVAIDTGTRWIMYDWKCHIANDEFADYNIKKIRQQLLAYAAYPAYESNPLPIDAIEARIYYPTTGDYRQFRFSQDDLYDLEDLLDIWEDYHQRSFSSVQNAIFQNMRGPRHPDKVCPHCEMQRLCVQNIRWQDIK